MTSSPTSHAPSSRSAEPLRAHARLVVDPRRRSQRHGCATSRPPARRPRRHRSPCGHRTARASRSRARTSRRRRIGSASTSRTWPPAARPASRSPVRSRPSPPAARRPGRRTDVCSPSSGAAERGSAVWIVAADGSGARRLTSGGQPQWSPRAEVLAFVRARAVFTIRADGSGERRVATLDAPPANAPRWSPDGSFLAVAAGRSLITIDVSAGTSRQLASSFGGVSDPAWSPDGRWIAYVGRLLYLRSELYVAQARGRRRVVRVTRDLALVDSPRLASAVSPDRREPESAAATCRRRRFAARDSRPAAWRLPIEAIARRPGAGRRPGSGGGQNRGVAARDEKDRARSPAPASPVCSDQFSSFVARPSYARSAVRAGLPSRGLHARPRAPGRPASTVLCQVPVEPVGAGRVLRSSCGPPRRARRAGDSRSTRASARPSRRMTRDPRRPCGRRRRRQCARPRPPGPAGLSASTHADPPVLARGRRAAHVEPPAARVEADERRTFHHRGAEAGAVEGGDRHETLAVGGPRDHVRTPRSVPPTDAVRDDEGSVDVVARRWAHPPSAVGRGRAPPPATVPSALVRQRKGLVPAHEASSCSGRSARKISAMRSSAVGSSR